jgi:hypothetical protein
MPYISETYLRADLTDICHVAEQAIDALDAERADDVLRRVVELHTQAGNILHRMTTDALVRDERGSAFLSAVAVVACWGAVVLFALALVAGWLDWWPTDAR